VSVAEPAVRTETVLSVRDLVVEVATPSGPRRAVEGVSFDLHREEVLAIVGESGSGKSLTMLAVMGLLPAAATVASGTIDLLGRDLHGASPSELREMRGKDVAMVFQDSMSALNPLMKIGTQIGEMIRTHEPTLSRRAVRARAVELLRLVNVPNPAERAKAYPHEFSGGMRQRAMIAMAIAHSPTVLIADEPTTALDVTTQAQILSVLGLARATTRSAMVLVTHDLGVVAEVAHTVAVMYGGSIVEIGSADQVLHAPRHPYTRGLLASRVGRGVVEEIAYAIPGQPPSISARPSGCTFHPRCDHSAGRALCSTTVPILDRPNDDHAVACHFPLVAP
jgi:oligopeptide/dipeptide ABC transporter ATP-binding protein